MRVYEVTAPEAAQNLRLENYLIQALPVLPHHVIRDAIKKRDVKMNGKRVQREDEIIPGSVIQLYTAYSYQLPIVFEDDRILLVNKPAGISCDDDGRGGMTVIGLMEEYAKGAYKPRLCHRLDHVTCGLLLLAKDDESEQCLLDAFKERRLEKIYHCLVRGEMRPSSALKEAFLIKDAEKAKVRIITHETPGAVNIATKYDTMSYDGMLSRLRVTLLTGRTHQIRAHMAFLSHPILGDDKYGDRALNKRLKANGLKLCAAELTLHTNGCLAYLDGRKFEIQTPF